MTAEFEVTQTLDTSGTRCPIPMLRTKQALREMVAGENIRVLTTDPAAKHDFEAMLKHLPHDLLFYQAREGDSNVDSFIIRKG